MVSLLQFVSFWYQNIDFSCTEKYQTHNQANSDNVKTPNLQSYATLQHTSAIKNKKVKKNKKTKVTYGVAREYKTVGWFSDGTVWGCWLVFVARDGQAICCHQVWNCHIIKFGLIVYLVLSGTTKINVLVPKRYKLK